MRHHRLFTLSAARRSAAAVAATATLALALVACDRGSTDAPSGEVSASSAKKEAAPKGDEPTKPAADAEKPAPAAAPSCDKVVDNIASFNPGSGEAERKLWNKMCAEMSDDEKTCVAAAKDMDGMKKCMAEKKLR